MSALDGRKRPTTAANLKRALVASGKRGDLPAFVASLPAASVEGLLADWSIWARREQLPPKGRWRTWMMLGGRGAGKTRAGAEWVHGVAMGLPFAKLSAGRIALVGETFQDAREVMVEGVSGLLSIGRRDDRPTYQSSRRRVEWPNGAIAQLFSAADPEGLRGPQFGAAWSDELAKWRDCEAVWDMLQFGLRLGDRPRQVVTTTPRPIPLVRKLMADRTTSVTSMRTTDNAANLARGFIEAIVDAYGGTRLGRQELDGEIIDDRDDALWSRDEIEVNRVAAAPAMRRIVVAVDPPASSGANSAACGIVATGLGEDGRGYVLADRTLRRATPKAWADRAASLYHALGADALIAEVNQGGEMVVTVIGEADPSIPVTAVRATRGKWTRAEPVALLYAQGRISHVGVYPALEDQMCNFSPNGTSEGVSPDRIDALVWALSSLMLGQKDDTQPRVRRFG